MENDNTRSVGTNRDPITGAPGAHPVGVGLGAAAGGIAAGAAAGTVTAGPVGTVVGAAVGAIAGGLGGKAVAEHFDPTLEGTATAAETEHDLRTIKLPLVE
jgi:phage tail tape-measure protein